MYILFETNSEICCVAAKGLNKSVNYEKKGLFQLKVLLSLRISFSVTQYDLRSVDWSQFKSVHLAAIFTVSNY